MTKPWQHRRARSRKMEREQTSARSPIQMQIAAFSAFKSRLKAIPHSSGRVYCANKSSRATCTTDKIKQNYFVSFSTVCRKSQAKQILGKFRDKKSQQVRRVRHAPQPEFVKWQSFNYDSPYLISPGVKSPRSEIAVTLSWCNFF